MKTATLDGCNRSVLEAEDVARALRIKLPFRLRLGPFRRLNLDADGRFVAFCRNRLEHTRSWPADVRFTKAEMDAVNTDLLLVDFRPRIEPGKVEELRLGEPSFPFVFLRDDEIEETLNHFLMACQEAHGMWSRGNHITPIRENDLYDAIECEYRVLMSPCRTLTDAEAMELLDDPLDSKAEWPMTLYDPDLSEETIEQIPVLMAEHGGELHREFAFLARMRMTEHDRRVALLMAVIALEGAHGRLLAWELDQRLRGTPKQKREITTRFLKDQGFHVLNEVTPELFLAEDERPTLETLAACRKGIEIRNAIMHAGIDSKGAYKMHKYSAKEMYDAYNAVLETYECYRRALSARQQSRSDHRLEDQ